MYYTNLYRQMPKVNTEVENNVEDKFLKNPNLPNLANSSTYVLQGYNKIKEYCKALEKAPEMTKS